MASGYKIFEPSGKTTVIVAEDKDQAYKRIGDMQERWGEYCDRNWLNDSGDLFSPEAKVKRFLDMLAYYYMLGNTRYIETDYKKVMHAKREIPMSSCPTFVENLMYASGSATSAVDQEERAAFREMTERLDAQAEKYEAQKQQRKRQESKFHKRCRLGIRGGEWCRVDTDGVFEYDGQRYMIDKNESQYQPVDTEFGKLYDMDRILTVSPDRNEFYDMNYDKVKVWSL